MKTTIILVVETDEAFDLVDVALIQSENLLSYLTIDRKAIESACIESIETGQL